MDLTGYSYEEIANYASEHGCVINDAGIIISSGPTQHQSVVIVYFINMAEIGCSDETIGIGNETCDIFKNGTHENVILKDAGFIPGKYTVLCNTEEESSFIMQASETNLDRMREEYEQD